jgi:hypothetical protein
MPITALFRKTWLDLIKETTPELTSLFASYADEGLVTVNKIFNQAADFLIMNEKAPAPAYIYDILLAIEDYDLPTQLQVLRFGKRYADPEVSEDFKKDAIRGFLERNNRIKLFDRRSFSPFFLDICKYVRERIWTKSMLKFKASDFDVWSDMPSGATAEGLHTHFEKWMYLNAVTGTFLGVPCRVTSTAINSRLVVVPKNYKTPRIICEEPLLRQKEQTRAMKKLINAIESSVKGPFHMRNRITLKSQLRNRTLARLGSYDRSLATVDVHAASDSLSYRTLHALIPQPLVNEVCSLLATSVELPNGSVKPLYIAGTMGARVTFPLESIIFWTAVCIAAEICIRCGVGTYDWLRYCSVYGDDIIIPVEWYETLVDVLSVLGFKVNLEKSFSGDHPYRESCGGEYYDGFEVASIYWPRRQLNGTIEDIPSLIKLANRLYTIGAPRAYLDVVKAIDTLLPGVPRVSPGADDLGIYTKALHRRYFQGYLYDIDVQYTESEYHRPFVSGRILKKEPDTSNKILLIKENIVTTKYKVKNFTSTVFDQLTKQCVNYLYELYRYERFLACGPQYDDGLLELLHVSSCDQDFGKKIPNGYDLSSIEYTDYNGLV